jgi:hypothetical protein
MRIFTIAASALFFTAAVASAQSLAMISYGCIGEKTSECNSRFGNLEGDITYERDCAWHDSQYPNDLNQAFASEVCNLTNGAVSHSASRIRTQSGDRCGYAYVQIVCFLKPN